jgi:pimeloyl-ACP methyl ester carboxylesterase
VRKGRETWSALSGTGTGSVSVSGTETKTETETEGGGPLSGFANRATLPAMAGRLEPTRDGNWLDWGGGGLPLHFAHANGFPPATFRKLIEVLRTGHHVYSMEARPLWPGSDPREVDDWSQLADDLRLELDRRAIRGAIGVGHSMGAVITSLAAVDDPKLFRAVVAIDPVMLAGWVSIVWGTMKAIGVGDQLPLVRGARTRTEWFCDKEGSTDPYRKRRLFRHWLPEVFDDYWDAALVSDGSDGWTLRYPRLWEARIFRVSPHNVWPQLRQLRVPSLFIQGEHSDVFFPNAVRRVRREVPGARVQVFEGYGHCVPMENPQGVGEDILRFAAEVNG